MTILNQYDRYFAPTYSNYPQGRYITLIVSRWIESEAIFRTEGSGEPLNREIVHAGLANKQPIQRIVISKRKQTAVERRTGRELLRRHELLFTNKDKVVCALNTNNPCEQCIDCMVYGFAAGGGGAQKSRVITDDAFSIHPVGQVLDSKTFNAPFDNSSPWDRDNKKQMTGLGEDEYVKPESVFLDMETLKDVTEDEFIYVLGNVLRSSRYGAISSRIGKVKNVLLGVVFSDCELFSNLELTQMCYDRLLSDKEELDFPLEQDQLHQVVQQSATELLGQVIGETHSLSADELSQLLDGLQTTYSDPDTIKTLLAETSRIYAPQA